MQLSIIVPVYNCEKYLEKCIDSILKQTYRDFELILVNDGSKDKSGKICDEYAEKDNKVKVVHQNNKGVISARKAGLTVSTGKYVAYVDSDDWIDKDMYEEMMKKTETHDADVVICGMVRETEVGQISFKSGVREGLYDKAKLVSEIYDAMLFDFERCAPLINPSLCNKVINRNLLQKVIFDVNDTIVFGEDALCSYPVLLDAEKIYIINSEWYHYRQNRYSVTNSYDAELLHKFMILHDELKRQFEERKFDYKNQLDGYIARFSLECIRQELLGNIKQSVKERIEIVRAYIDDKRVSSAVDITINKICERKTKTKLKLVKKNKLELLYCLFFMKQKLLMAKGSRYKN